MVSSAVLAIPFGILLSLVNSLPLLALIRNFGIPTVLNGQAGFIPVPIIFQVGSLISLLALIPLFFIHKEA